MKTKHTQIAIACLSLDLMPEASGGARVTATTPPIDIQLTPAGYFRAGDGRPADAPQGWYIDHNIAIQLIADVALSQNDLVIDYEHQTLHKERNGQPAPAAGWFKRLEWRATGDNPGLWAVGVKWTDPAKAAILSGQYRYLSPVFTYQPQTGHITAVKMAAITNSPGLDGLQALADLSLDHYLQCTQNTHNSSTKQEVTPMWKALLAKLGLPETATEDEAMAALTAIQTKADKAEEYEPKITALTEQVTTLQAAEPDPAKFVPVEVVNGLKTELAALTQEQAAASVDTTVAKAIEDGLLRPVEKGWATKLGQSNMAALTEYIGNQAPIAALAAKQADPGTPTPSKTAALTDNQKSVARAFGLTDAEFKQTLNEYGE
ncbi:hypothetical protein AVO42_00440 [Thiomicrospira sp. XS5]|uniref:phage protease n=1 Tax=Thiomicrospira sp. XS5 TaxID=1775636 RepID=UPI00074A9AB0|nr:phage protease [Thiomicrospira sp. XS5]KUJ73924.1 hypothetical protein AVO42_00440 [Thiomicrospira sp. XS5]